MSKIDVIHAWKDEEFFLSLSDQERSMIPESPAGAVELTDADLVSVEGGTGWYTSLITVCFPTLVTLGILYE